jgi:integrase
MSLTTRLEEYEKRGRTYYRVEYAEHGKRRRKLFPCTAAGRDAAEAFQAACLTRGRERRALGTEAAAVGTLGAFATRWLERSLGALRPSSQALYRHHVEQNLLPYPIAAQALDTITRADVIDWLETVVADHQRAGNLGGATVRLALSVLHRVLEAAADKNLIRGNPASRLGSTGIGQAIGQKKCPRKRHALRALDAAQLECVLRTAAPEWSTALVVLSATGMRVGELCGLHVGDLDLAAGTVMVERSTSNGGRHVYPPKTGTGRRVHLSALAVAALRKHLRDRKALRLRLGLPTDPVVLFFDALGGYIHARTVREVLAKVAKAAGLPGFGPHTFRHTIATRLLAAGESLETVARLLGHADVRLTTTTYGRPQEPPRPVHLDALDTGTTGSV